MEFTVQTTSETEKLARELAHKIRPMLSKGVTLALYGDLGSGKTTFTNYFTKALGINTRVQSPTFVIARKYSNNDLTINHLDLYRLKNESELDDLDLHQFLISPHAVTLIEWPQIAENLLPKNTVKIYFEYLEENSRRINVENLY